MGGWKTWTAAILSIGYGVGGFMAGMHGPDTMMQGVVTGLGLIGIGHKIEKYGDPLKNAQNQRLRASNQMRL